MILAHYVNRQIYRARKQNYFGSIHTRTEWALDGQGRRAHFSESIERYEFWCSVSKVHLYKDYVRKKNFQCQNFAENQPF